jgi:hypothetical protein
MKFVGKVSEMSGTAFTMFVGKAEEVPAGTNLYIDDGQDDTIRFKELVEAIARKDVAFFAIVSKYSPKAASIDEVRKAIDMALAELKTARETCQS